MPDALSLKLYNSNLGKTFIIEGPFGNGLELKDDDKGDFVIFVAGTGILPFLDLFEFLLRKMILAQIFCENTDFNYLDNINIHLFASF